MPERENSNGFVRPGYDTCGAKPADVEYVCTRAAGHEAEQHIAHTSGGRIAYIWPHVPDLADPEAIDQWLST